MKIKAWHEKKEDSVVYTVEVTMPNDPQALRKDGFPVEIDDPKKTVLNALLKTMKCSKCKRWNPKYKEQNLSYCEMGYRIQDCPHYHRNLWSYFVPLKKRRKKK